MRQAQLLKAFALTIALGACSSLETTRDAPNFELVDLCQLSRHEASYLGRSIAVRGRFDTSVAQHYLLLGDPSCPGDMILFRMDALPNAADHSFNEMRARAEGGVGIEGLFKGTVVRDGGFRGLEVTEISSLRFAPPVPIRHLPNG